MWGVELPRYLLLQTPQLPICMPACMPAFKYACMQPLLLWAPNAPPQRAAWPSRAEFVSVLKETAGAESFSSRRRGRSGRPQRLFGPGEFLQQKDKHYARTHMS